MPLLCFTCGMPVNNFQSTYEWHISNKKTPLQALTEMGFDRPCCKTMLLTAAEDPRLRRRPPVTFNFVKVEEASKLKAKYRLPADGRTEPLGDTQFTGVVFDAPRAATATAAAAAPAPPH